MKCLQKAVVVAVVAGSMLASNVAMAQWSLFGGAETVKAGKEEKTKGEKWSTLLESSAEVPFSGISFEPDDSITLADLDYLGTQFAADDIGGGSPRFAIGLDEDGNGFADGNLVVYLGPYPDYVAQNLAGDTGNLLESTDPIFDATQIGGTFYDTLDNAITLAGDAEIVYIALVVDSYWAVQDQQQLIFVDNVRIDIDGKKNVYSEKGKRLGHFKD